MSSMIGFPGQAASVMYTVESSNVLTAAQAGPTYTLYKNGSVVDTTSGSPTVTLTAANPATGVYRCSFTIPGGWAVTDVVELFAATGTTGSAFVGRWVLVPASLLTLPTVPTFPDNFAALGISAGGAISTVTTLTNLPAITSNWLTAAGLAADAVAEIQSGLATQTSVDTIDDLLDTEIAAIQTSIADIPTNAELTTAINTGRTTAMTESYPTLGAAPTLEQAMFVLMAHMNEAEISGTTKTVKKLDGSTTAATFTLDSATAPTSITRAT